MKKYLENDEDVEILETWKDLKEYLTFRAKHDEWVQPFINELAAIGIPNHPLFFQTNCTNLSVQKNGYRLDVKDIDYEDPENLSCIEDTGLFLVFPYKDSMAVYPTRRILKHMIASHHGKLEYGAITVPSIPEAMILHELDMIDSRIYQFEQVRKDLEPGSMSDKIFGLDTRVYRPL